MRNAKLIRSISSKGCSPDNAACEGFFGWLKTELFYPRDWQMTTIEQFTAVVHAYIHWYTKGASKSPLAHSVLSNTQRASDLRHKPIQNFRCTLPDQIVTGVTNWGSRSSKKPTISLKNCIRFFSSITVCVPSPSST